MFDIKNGIKLLLVMLAGMAFSWPEKGEAWNNRPADEKEEDFEMVRVEGSVFLMGCTDEKRSVHSMKNLFIR